MDNLRLPAAARPMHASDEAVAATLHRMQRRASVWSECLPRLPANSTHCHRRGRHLLHNSHGAVPRLAKDRPPHPESPLYDEVLFCPRRRVAFIHIFKSAGTTIVHALKSMCRNWVLVCPWHLYCRQTLDAAHGTVGEYAYFTFVRDPVARFTSGVLEAALRKNLKVIQAGVPAGAAANTAENADAIARRILTACVASPRLCDAHLEPQLSFLATLPFPRGRPKPVKLDYLGSVEHIEIELPAIVQRFFGTAAAANVSSMLQTSHRVRSETNQEQVRRLLGRLSGVRYNQNVSQITSFVFTPDDLLPPTIAMIRRAYGSDVECLQLSR